VVVVVVVVVMAVAVGEVDCVGVVEGVEDGLGLALGSSDPHAASESVAMLAAIVRNAV
jgi:hypothetical protein